MLNSVITKTLLYGRGFSFLKLVFRLFTTACVEVKLCIGQKVKQYECQSN